MATKRQPPAHTSCIECRRAMPQGLRSDARFCSPSCRNACHNARKGRVRPVTVSGSFIGGQQRPTVELAREFGTEVVEPTMHGAARLDDAALRGGRLGERMPRNVRKAFDRLRGTWAPANEAGVSAQLVWSLDGIAMSFDESMATAIAVRDLVMRYAIAAYVRLTGRLPADDEPNLRDLVEPIAKVAAWLFTETLRRKERAAYLGELELLLAWWLDNGLPVSPASVCIEVEGTAGAPTTREGEP